MKQLLIGGLIATLLPLNVLAAAPPEHATVPYVWGNVAIFGGGFVSGIVTHPTQRGLMYARTDIGGAYRWDDAGHRWIALTDWLDGDGWNHTGIESLAVDPADPNRLYMATGTYTNQWSGNGAILRSDDRGATWLRTDLPFKNGGNEDGRNGGERLAVDPRDGNILLFGTRNNGLLRSADRGATWRQLEGFPVKGRTNGVGLVFVVFDGAGGAFVGCSGGEAGLYHSAGGEAPWQVVADQPRGLVPNHAALSSDGALYLTYGNAPGPNGMSDGAVWKYDTRARRWTDVSPIKPGGADRFGYGGVSVDARRPGSILVSTMDRWTRKDTIFLSSDGGATWESLLEKASFDYSAAPYTKRSKPHWIGDVEIDPFDSDRAIFVTGYGVWACRNLTATGSGKPTHWTFDNQGLEECVINDVISPGAGDAMVLSAMWDLDGFRHLALDASPPAGNFQPSMGRCTSIDFAELRPEVIARVYGGNNTHGSYSSDNGSTWTAFNTAPPGNGDGTIAVAADGSALVWAPEGGAPCVSSDQGRTWTASRDVPAGVRVVSDRVNAGRFYALHARDGTVYASADAGKSFTESTPSRSRPSGGAIRAVPGHEGHLWLAAGDGLHRSADGGKTFSTSGEFQSARRVGFGKAAPGQSHPAVYVVGKLAGVYGFYRSDDAGASWMRINDDQHQFATINAITGDPRVFGRVYLASANRGVIYGQPGEASK